MRTNLSQHLDLSRHVVAVTYFSDCFIKEVIILVAILISQISPHLLTLMKIGSNVAQFHVVPHVVARVVT